MTEPANMAQRANVKERAVLPLGVAAIGAFLGVVVANSWLVDDAYITLRSVDQFVNGNGLRWNTFERVQVYTHPLWMLVLSAVYAVTREGYFTLLAPGWLASVGALALGGYWIVRTERSESGSDWRAALTFSAFTALLLASRAFVDYSTSGLENPLSHLLCGWFFFETFTKSRGAVLALIASLAFVNRQDSVLVFLPALTLALGRLGAGSPRSRLRRAVELLLASSPAWLWSGFAVVYYGALLPNTAYAKLLAHGASAESGLLQGGRYLAASWATDPATLGCVAVGAALAVRQRAGPLGPERLALALGALSYVAYVAGFAASGTHMAGRFLTLPFFASALLVVESLRRRSARSIGSLGLVFVLLQLTEPASPVRTLGCGWIDEPAEGPRWHGVLDTRRYVCFQGGALLRDLRAGEPLPNHAWYRAGLAARKASRRAPVVNVGGADDWGAIGYFGFAAGPQVRIIDRLALGDPLLARLPMKHGADQLAGHYERELPRGYVESVTTLENRLVDPRLHRFYEDVRLVTQAPLLSPGRLEAILRWNSGPEPESEP